MTARWGFDLDMSAVRLMRREGDAWLEEARENIDGPDIEERLMALAEKIDDGQDVHLFLPRDQILYTDVKITSEENADAEIAAAMDGRTPYALDELCIDWTVTEPGTARVAAIAEETLDEAVTFARARSLGVAGLSSLAGPKDFPRLPLFRQTPGTSEPKTPGTETPEPEATLVKSSPTFVSGRTPPEALPTDGPVLRIDDTTPVMRVKSNPLPPLDPGAPLQDANTPPRVRTDIAAGTLSGVAASLTPDKPSVRVHAPRSAPWRTLVVFILAAILTIGVAIIVWSVLPMAPGRSELPAPPATQTSQTKELSAPDERAEITSEPAQADGPALPQPDAVTDLATLSETPVTDTAPHRPSSQSTVARAEPMALAAALIPTVPRPTIAEPKQATPAALASLSTSSPIQSLDGSEDMAETTLDIYIASIERRDLAFDAIALPVPDTSALVRLPQITGPPTEAVAGNETEAETEDQTDLAAAPAILNPVTPLAPARRLQPARRLSGPEPGADTETAPTAESPAAEAPAVVENGPAPAEQAEPLLPRPTALAAALPDRQPRPRPEAFTQDIERQKFGGRTRSELAKLLPPPRPESAQVVALASRTTDVPAEASDLAVRTSLAPKTRPGDFDALVATARAQVEAARTVASLDFETPDTSAAIEAALANDAEPEPRPQDSPRLAIPSSASVARQATIEDAIRLNKINLVGVYGIPSDRRALIRLPSGRYVKVKVGDRIDGGTVAQIGDSQLIYRKGSRTHALTMPKG